MDEETKILAVFNAYDKETIDLYTHAENYAYIVREFKDYLRQLIKYGHYFKTVEEALDELQKKIYDLSTDEHLPPDY
jgi:replicative DNA helicase